MQYNIYIYIYINITKGLESILFLIAFSAKRAMWIIDVSIIVVTNYDIFRTRVTLCEIAFHHFNHFFHHLNVQQSLWQDRIGRISFLQMKIYRKASVQQSYGLWKQLYWHELMYHKKPTFSIFDAFRILYQIQGKPVPVIDSPFMI